MILACCLCGEHLGNESMQNFVNRAERALVNYFFDLSLLFRSKPCPHSDYWYQIGRGKFECHMCGKRFHK